MNAASISTSITPASARLGVMLTDLRLPTIKRLAGDLCAQSDLEGWPAHRLLEALLEHEINERESRRMDRHRMESGLSPDKRLSSFDFAAVPSVSKAQVMALAKGTQWLDRGQRAAVWAARRGQEPLDLCSGPCPD
jgi:DNA replication protein DnaC